MTTPSAAETSLLRSRPHNTKLWLSIYQPDTVLSCQVSGTHSKGDRDISYDSVTAGSYLLVEEGMTMYVGSSAGDDDLGKIRVRSATASQITVAENSYIGWADNQYLTVVRYFEINPVFPRIILETGTTNTYWYKDYDIDYTDQNSVLGSFICMGGHYAGFLDNGSHQVYYTASGTSNVKGDTLSYFWFFQGATTTGSTSHTPGYITYNTPGHYTTRLIVSGSSGSGEYSYRHVSIYDRPGSGTSTPILSWNLGGLSGSRDQGGYSGTLRIDELVPTSTLRDGSLIVLWSDDRYGTTDQSISGNELNRSKIFFSGYVVDGTIRYNYRNSYVEFGIGSPTEIMKMAEGFSVSVQDSDDPAGDAASDPNIPSGWVVLLDMDTKRALYHYLRWHSTVLKCCDFEFIGTNQPIQYFDSDRTSLYDAINTLMNSALWGRVSSDRLGKIWAENSIYLEPNNFDTGLSVTNSDWMNDPIIEERQIPETSYIEAGGIAYNGSTFSAHLSAAPGTAPGYRGKVERVQGLALTDQDQLNTLVGNLYAQRNARYPNIEMQMAGNYRNFDIAPQEKIPLTVNATDTARGITFTNKNFWLNGIQWTYDPSKELLLPTISLAELTSGSAGDTLAIPDVPPVESEYGGFGVPPIIIPPISIPPFPDLGGGNFPEFVQMSSSDQTGYPYPGAPCYHPPTGNSDAGAQWKTPRAYTGTIINIYPVVETASGGGTNEVYCRVAVIVGRPSLSGESQGVDSITQTTTVSSGQLVMLNPYTFDYSLFGYSSGDEIVFNIYLTRLGSDPSDDFPAALYSYGFYIEYL